jgi:hypothetical protein
MTRTLTQSGTRNRAAGNGDVPTSGPSAAARRRRSGDCQSVAGPGDHGDPALPVRLHTTLQSRPTRTRTVTVTPDSDSESP